MKVLYRITDIPSTNPSPIYSDNKPRLNKVCLRSFLKAFEGVDMDIAFLCDFCSFETMAMIRELCPEGEVIDTHLGINETMLKAYDIAFNSNDEIILFQECDYYWLPNMGKTFYEALKSRFSLLSPYDHLNFYIDQNIHSNQVSLECFNGHHYRTTERNTMTFGVTKKCFLEGRDIFKKYGYLDNDVWKEMREDKKYALWTPIPTFATHMVKDYLSPGIDWEAIWKTLI